MLRLLMCLVGAFAMHAFPQEPLVFRRGRGLTLGRDDATFADPIAFTKNGPLWNGGGGGAGGEGGTGAGDGTTSGGAGGGAGPPSASATPDLVGLKAVIDEANRTGATTATTQVLQALGFDTLDAATAFVTKQREAEQAAMSEAERREAEAAKREAAAQKKSDDAAKATLHAQVVSHLVIAGVAPANAGDLVGLVSVQAGADDAAVKTAVEATKAKFPALFTAAAGVPAPSSLVGGGPPATGHTSTGLAAGAKRAKEVRDAREAMAGGGKESLFSRLKSGTTV